MTHHLKTWTEYFEDILNGKKNFELRKNDRNYQVGDILVLEEYVAEKDEYTGRSVSMIVDYILEGGSMGLEKGYVIMAIHSI